MNFKKISLLISIYLIGIVLGIVSMYTPRPQGMGTTDFSAKRAETHIKAISRAPHDASDVLELLYVRTYIEDYLADLGYGSEINSYNYKDVDYGFGDIVVNNLLTTIPGQNDSYILIVAHYDSSAGHRSAERPGSYGAADDGYGVATMLEIAKIISDSERPLVNGIKLLFTDAEEIGMIGAELEVKNNPAFFENVGFVINLEARGVKGPAIMFETSSNNRKVIDFYKHANLPVAYSFAGDVYEKMPNGTDFTHFKNHGLNGINFAVLDSLDYYHTPNDNFENISLTSVQHYGEQVLPLVKEYVYHRQYSDVDYFSSSQSAIYFTMLPNVFIQYIAVAGYVMMALLIVLLGIILFILNKNDNLSLVKVLKWTGLMFVSMLIFLMIGVIISYLISLVTDMNFSLTYMPQVKFSLGIFIMMLLSEVALWMIFTYKHKEEAKPIFFAALTFNTIFLIIFMIVLPGGSYVFLWPILIGIMTFFTANFIKCDYLKTMVMGINIILGLLLFIPILYLVYLALTIGALGIIGLLAFFPITMISSSFILIINKVNS